MHLSIFQWQYMKTKVAVKWDMKPYEAYMNYMNMPGKVVSVISLMWP